MLFILVLSAFAESGCLVVRPGAVDCQTVVRVAKLRRTLPPKERRLTLVTRRALSVGQQALRHERRGQSESRPGEGADADRDRL